MFATLDVSQTFDFENQVQRLLPALADSHIQASVTTSSVLGLTHTRIDPKHRSIVCLHWLHGLCQKGSDCEFLHKLDKQKMPLCRHGQSCKTKNCQLKHVDVDTIPECVFFKQGFCFHGSTCKYRHVKLSPDVCPPCANFEQSQDTDDNAAAPLSKKRKTQAPNSFFKISLCKHWLQNGVCPFGDECHFAHSEAELKGFSGTDDLDDSDIFDPVKSKMNDIRVVPWNSDANVAYFIAHSPDIRSMVVSRRRGVWAMPVTAAAEVNLALQSSVDVILIFFVQSLNGVYGCAKVKGAIPPPNPMIPISPEFPVEWIRTTRISLKMVSPLKMPDGNSVARTAYDGTLTRIVGYEILLVLLRKHTWDWAQNMKEAESGKYDEERRKSTPLPPDVLFPPSWYDRAKKVMMTAGDRAALGGTGAPEYYYDGNLPGFIIGCRTDMFQEIMGRGIFGLPYQLKEIASQQIEVGCPLFLLDTQANMFFGLFEALSPAIEDMVPEAFKGGKGLSAYPIHVRFKVVLEVAPLHGNDNILKPIFNISRPLNVGPLTLQETKQLSNVFAIKKGVMRDPSQGNVKGVGPDSGHKNYSAGYKPPFDHVETVIVDIPMQDKGGAFISQVRRTLLGPNAVNVLNVLKAVAPFKTAVARLRGIGSGYPEGPQKEELQEPMQFCVSVKDEVYLPAVVDGMKQLIAQVRNALT